MSQASDEATNEATNGGINEAVNKVGGQVGSRASDVLPGGPREVVDPFAVLSLDPANVGVPMPLEALRDPASRAVWPDSDMVGHLFNKDDAARLRAETTHDLDAFLAAMDAAGIGRVGVPLASTTPDEIFDRLADLGGRVFVSLRVNPHDGLRGLRRAADLCRRYPFIPPNSKEYYPVYAKAAELERAVFVNIGFPGPRVPAHYQDPIHLDEVCWFFPELTVVMRHGGLPWAATCVQMLLRWPNLYYATTAMAPKHYPREIVELANTRGADKIIFAGYWPLLSYERVFGELAALPLRDHVWDPLLAGNASRAFGLDPVPAPVAAQA